MEGDGVWEEAGEGLGFWLRRRRLKGYGWEGGERVGGECGEGAGEEVQ